MKDLDDLLWFDIVRADGARPQILPGTRGKLAWSSFRMSAELYDEGVRRLAGLD